MSFRIKGKKKWLKLESLNFALMTTLRPGVHVGMILSVRRGQWSRSYLVGVALSQSCSASELHALVNAFNF